MKIEYKATFVKVNKNAVRDKLRNAEAKKLRSEFLQKRITLNTGHGRFRSDVPFVLLSIVAGERK